MSKWMLFCLILKDWEVQKDQQTQIQRYSVFAFCSVLFLSSTRLALSMNKQQKIYHLYAILPNKFTSIKVNLRLGLSSEAFSLHSYGYYEISILIQKDELAESTLKIAFDQKLVILKISTRRIRYEKLSSSTLLIEIA